MCDQCAKLMPLDGPPVSQYAKMLASVRIQLVDGCADDVAKSAVGIAASRVALIRQYRRTFRDAAARGIADVLSLVHQLDVLDPTVVDDVLSTMTMHLGVDNMGTTLVARAAAKMQAIYSMAARQVQRGYKISTVDRRAIKLLGDHNLVWIRHHYNDDLMPSFKEIAEKSLSQGYNRAKLAQALADGLGDVVDGDAHYWTTLADSTATRIREVGRVTGFEAAGIKRVRVQRNPRRSADAKPCICDDMDGQVISVSHLRGQVDALLAARSKPELMDAMGTEHKRYGGGALPSNLGLPQYHNFCACTLKAEVGR